MKTTTIAILSIVGVIGLVVLYNSYQTGTANQSTINAQNVGYLSQATTSQNLALMKASQQVAASQASSSNSGGSMGSIMSIVGMVAAML